MNCEKVLESIFSGERVTPEAEEHIKNCEPCRTAHEDWNILKDVKTNSEAPPKGIDLLILSESRNFISNRTVIKKALFRWVSLAATAACVMISAWICLDFVKSNAEQQSLNKTDQVIHNIEPFFPIETTQVSVEPTEVENELKFDSSSFEEMVEEELFKLNVDIEATNSLLYFSNDSEDDSLLALFGS
jgi:hypothetical protein